MKKIMAILVCVALHVTVANAYRHNVLLGSSNVSTHSPSNTALGDYYVVSFEVPDEVKGRWLDKAYLEFYVDAAAIVVNGYLNKTPVIEVYALKSAFSGSVNVNQFEPQTVPAMRNIVVGQNRRVVIDITEMVRSYIETPSKNHGLIIGSLTGDRDGDFTLTNNQLGPAASVKISFFY